MAGWTFTYAQKRGIVVLLLLILALVVGLGVVDHFRSEKLPENLPDKVWLDSLNAPLLELNAASRTELEDLPGIGPVLARRIVKFREIRGGFSSPEELSEVYGLRPETLDRILPRLYADTSLRFEPRRRPGNFTRRHYERVELNAADSASLEALPGIGPVLARRILRYRDARGGFSAVEEVQRVYGFSEENFERAQPYIYVVPRVISDDTEARAATIEVADINAADSAAFERLPGIGSVLSGRIVRFRRARRGFGSVADLREVYGFSEENFERARPYLRYDPTTRPEPEPARSLDPGATTRRVVPPDRAIDLNAADSSALVSVPGIGAKTARRIIRYRTRIGFFVDPAQMRQVYGVSEENYARMRPHLRAEVPANPPRNSLRTVSEAQLRAIIGRDAARDLYEARQAAGWFDDWAPVEAVVGAERAGWLRGYFTL